MYNKLSLGFGVALVTAVGSVSAANVSLEDYVSLVLEQNSELAYQRLDVDIASEAITLSQQEFDTQFTASATRTDTFVKNTTTEKLQRQSYAEYSAVDDNINIGFEKKVRFGTSLALSYDIQRANNSLQTVAGEDETEISSYVGISVVQPLLKNFGSENNTFAYEAARLDSEKSRYDFQSRASNIAREAVANYFDVQKTFHILNSRKSAVETAEKLLEDAQVLVQQGRLSEYDKLDIKATLAQRKAEFSIADQEYRMSVNRLQRLLPDPIDPTIIDRDTLPKISPLSVSLDDAYSIALTTRPDLANAHLQLKKEKIIKRSVENENNPELNLVISYGGNGLEENEGDSLQDALDGKYRTWSAGLEFSMPLGSDSRSSARRSAALKQQQSEIALSVLQRQVRSDLMQSYDIVQQVYSQLQQYKEILSGHKQRLEIDREKALQGNISYMELMRRRDLLNNIREKFIQNLFNYQKAKYEFFYHQGALLDQVSS